MRPTNSFAALVFIVILAIGAALAYAMYGISASWVSNRLIAATLIVAFVISFATKVADQWDRAVVLRLGRFHVLRGPGLFFIIPIIDTIPYWIDTRVITSSFTAERTLTKDTVPVNVDAVLFWKVVDPMKAALDVADYRGAINWAAQTALRDVIGKTVLSDMLEGREKISTELQKDHRRAHRAVGHQRHLRGGQGRVDSTRSRGCHVDAGASRTRASGPRHPGRFRAADCGEIRRGCEHLCQQSERIPFAGDEHAV